MFNDPRLLSHFYDLVQKVYASNTQIRFDKLLYATMNDDLVRNFNAGMGSISSDLNHPDHLRMSMFESNIARFAAAKTSREVLDLNRLKNTSKDFADFQAKANALNIKYNQGWLKAEYDTAQSVGQNANDYYIQVNNEDIFPFVQFDTVGDNKVRDEHAKLDGVTVRVGSKEHDLLTPPLGYNCRCRLKQLTEDEVKASKIKTEKEIMSTLKSSKVGNQSAYNVMSDYGFDINRAKTLQVFTEAQMYIRNFKETGLSFNDYSLSKYEDMRRQLPHLVMGKEDTVKWFEQRVGGNSLHDKDAVRLKDYRDRPILWSKKNYNFDQPQTAHIAIASPDEVWLSKDGKNWKRNYLKFYNNQTVLVEVGFGKNRNEEIIKASLVTQPDLHRKGLLLN